jgi:hypothetical protein
MVELISNKGTNGEPVTDKDGNPIQGAEIIAVSHGLNTDTKNQVIVVTQTDSNGEYAFTDQDLPVTYPSGNTPKTEYLDLYARIGSETDIRQATPIRPWQGYQLEATVPPSVIYRWKLDEGSGTTINDSVGNLSGTLKGGTWVSDSNSVGGAHIDFDGNDDFIEYGQVTNEPQMSLSFWINLDEIITGTSPVYPFYWSAKTSNSTGMFVAQEQSSWRIGINGEGSIYTNYSPSANVWEHFGLTYDSSGQLDIYVDGQFEEGFSNVSDGSINNGSRDLHIMEDSFGGSKNLDGQLDDVIVADSALSDSEMNDLYNLSPRA